MASTYFCVICGEALPYRNSFGRGKSYPICKSPDCLVDYVTMRNEAVVPIADKKVDPDAHYTKREHERYDGYCNRCGKPMRIDFRYCYFRHGLTSTCETAPETRKSQRTAQLKNHRRVFLHQAEPKPKPRIYLKPWQDKESLFCDTEFLETEILHKKIRTGEECKDHKS